MGPKSPNFQQTSRNNFDRNPFLRDFELRLKNKYIKSSTRSNEGLLSFVPNDCLLLGKYFT